MSADFHIYLDSTRGRIRVRQEGLLGERMFPSLTAATTHLRNATLGRSAHVVIHDSEGIVANRIPLQFRGRDQ